MLDNRKTDTRHFGPRDGYYHYQNEEYYYNGAADTWFEWDAVTGWLPVLVDDALSDHYEDYYDTDSYSSSAVYDDFADSEWYDDAYDYDYDYDYDYGDDDDDFWDIFDFSDDSGWSSWDSSDSDWDSDW